MKGKQNAWGRWGKKDERGALNLISNAVVRNAMRLAQSGRVFDLALPLDARHSRCPPHRCQPLHLMQRDGGDYAAGARRPGGFQFSDDVIVMATQTGTHLDALAHAWTDDHLYNGHPASGVRSTSGAQRCGIDKVGPLVTRGVLLDFVARNGGVNLPMEREISAGDVSALLKTDKISLEAGDAVMIRTGWIGQGLDGPDYYAGEPGIGVEAAKLLIEADCSLIGCDNFAVELQPSREKSPFPVHILALQQYGVHLMENVFLEELGASGVREFAFIAAPLKITGGVGSPVTPIAVI